MALIATSRPCVVIAGLALAVVSVSASSQFLQPTASIAIEGVGPKEVSDLRAEIGSIFGHDKTQNRLEELKDVLQPLYVTLSSDGKHGLGHAATRYALHRYFQKRHGWRVTGLAEDGRAWNSSSATDFLQGRVPAPLLEVFNERLGREGLDLQGVAVLAATVEHLVRVEAVTLMEQAYEAFQMPMESMLSESQVDNLMDMHMLTTFFAGKVPMHKMRWLYSKAQTFYPGWADTQMFVRDLRQNEAFKGRSKTNPFTRTTPQFDYMLHLIEASSDQFGQFQDLECQALNQILLSVEHRGTGRVRLSDFYGLAASGFSQFSETAEYLRDTGVLDETDEANPTVIIPNWLYSKSNCLGSSSYYAICCVNHCNGLLAHLEDEFRKPMVEPERLAAAVAQLSSATVSAPRNLSATMLQRLQHIAFTHNGVVPLHGRLFAQWMHHAFPRECPYPHVAGRVQVMDIPAWKDANGGRPAVYSKKELVKLGTQFGAAKFLDEDEDESLDASSWMMDEASEQETLWESEEETFLDVVEDTGRLPWSRVLRNLALMSATLSIIAVLVQAVISGITAAPASDTSKKVSKTWII